MVVFTCNACGQSVKKNQVEKHYKTVCRQCDVLSCIDCGKDFHGEEYATHTSCISEAEKYQGKLFKAKDKQNKGEQKQQAWIKHVQSASSGISDPRLANLVERLSAYDNIPRKRSKFENFCKNSVGVRDASLLSKLWDLFNDKPALLGNDNSGEGIADSTESTDLNSNVQENSVTENGVTEEKKIKRKKEKVSESLLGEGEEATKEKKSKRKKNKETSSVREDDIEKVSEEAPSKEKRKKDKKHNGEVNGDVKIEETDKKKGKKRKSDSITDEVTTKRKKEQDLDGQNMDAEETAQVTQTQLSGKFKWDSIIKRILKQTEGNEMKVKKLRKKVLAEYYSRGGDGKEHSDNELLALFDRKINKNPKFKVHKDRVSLKT